MEDGRCPTMVVWSVPWMAAVVMVVSAPLEVRPSFVVAGVVVVTEGVVSLLDDFEVCRVSPGVVYARLYVRYIKYVRR